LRDIPKNRGADPSREPRFGTTAINEFRFGVNQLCNAASGELAYVRDVLSELKIPGVKPGAGGRLRRAERYLDPIHQRLGRRRRSVRDPRRRLPGVNK
jgi:hypothetical protein